MTRIITERNAYMMEHSDTIPEMEQKIRHYTALEHTTQSKPLAMRCKRYVKLFKTRLAAAQKEITEA